MKNVTFRTIEVKYLLVLYLLCLTTIVNGQDWRIRAGATMGTFSMKGMKEMQEELVEGTSPLQTKIVTSFPLSVGFNLEASNVKKNVEWSYFYSYNSTGGRVHYADYTGEIKMDQFLHSHSLGVGASGKIKEWGQHQLKAGLRLSLAGSTLKLKNSVTIFDQVLESFNTTFKSLNVHTEPMLRYEYSFKKSYLFYVDAGFLFGLFQGDLTQNGDGNVTLELSNGKNLQAEWTGLRIGFGLAYRLNY